MRSDKAFFAHCLQWEQRFCSGGPRILLESAGPPPAVVQAIDEARVELGLAPRPPAPRPGAAPGTAPVDAHARLAAVFQEADQRPVSHLKDADDTRPQSLGDFLKDLSDRYGPKRDLPRVNPYTLGYRTLHEQQVAFEATKQPDPTGVHAVLAGVTAVDPALHARLRLAFTGGV